MKFYLAILATLFSNSAFAELKAEVSNFKHERGIATAILTIENSTGKHITSLSGECAFLDENKKPIDLGPFRETNIANGQTVYSQARIVTAQTPAFADCRIELVR